MIKVVITGPESSGKTTLATALATHYQTPWVPEYARTYLDRINRPYREADLLTIAQGQVQRENKAAHSSPSLLLCDTSLLVIRIWSYYRYHRCHSWIEEQLTYRPIDHYLLCRPDLAWQPDPQRENPHNRNELFELYQQALHNTPYTIIEGDRGQRTESSVETIDRLLSS